MIKVIKLTVFLILLMPSLPLVSAQEETVNFELTAIVKSSRIERITQLQMIKGFLEPLGIDLNIRVIPDPQWFSALDRDAIFPENYDLTALSRYSPGEIAFTSAWSQNDLSYYSDPALVAFQKEDTGVDQADVDEMVIDLQTEWSYPEYKKKLWDFAKFYQDKLLTEISLISNPILHTASIRSEFQGYEQSTVEWDESDDLINSILRGAYFEGNGEDRALYSNTSTLRISVSEYTTNVDKAFGIITGQRFIDVSYMIDYATGITPLFFDENMQNHPNMAVQYEISDWEQDDGTIIKGGRQKLYIRDDATWIRSDANGRISINASLQSYPVSVRDFAFTFKIYQSLGIVRPPGFVEMNETENSVTYYLTGGQQYNYQGLLVGRQQNVYPEFLLNQTLTVNENINGTPSELFALGILPYFTVEWQDYMARPVTAGPYEIVSMNSSMTQFRLRDDYFYPNEWDAPGSDFELHTPGSEEAYFLAFNATTQNPRQKPNTLPIKYIIIENVDPTNSMSFVDKVIELNRRFEQGRSDLFRNYATLLNEVSNEILARHVKDNRFKQVLQDVMATGDYLALNYDNPHLRKYNVRRAISQAIDKEVLFDAFSSGIDFGDYPFDQMGPISATRTLHNNTIGIPYDYNKARDLMRQEGYFARDTNELIIGSLENQAVTITVPFEETPVLFYTIFVPLLAVGIYFSLKRRKLNQSIK